LPTRATGWFPKTRWWRTIHKISCCPLPPPH